MTHPFSPLVFISFIITVGVIMGWTGYSIERQEARKAIINQEMVKW